MDLYISKAVVSAVRICIDAYNDSGWMGRIYTRLKKEPIEFRNMDKMIDILGSFWDIIGFPMESTIRRQFTDRQVLQSQLQKRVAIEVSYPEDGSKDKIKVELSEEDMDNKHGEQGTFIVKIRYRQNATWQGHVTWVEKNKTVPFRSALELIRLLDSTRTENEDEWTRE